MLNERMLERIKRYESGPVANQVGTSRQQIVKASIIKYLSHMLNTRKGSVPVDIEYGMSDLSNIAGTFAAGSIGGIEQEIIQKITRYERRLLSPKIKELVETREIITLKFALSGMIDLGTTQNPELREFSMLLRISSGGWIRIEVADQRNLSG
jgi:type VI secretion system protein